MKHFVDYLMSSSRPFLNHWVLPFAHIEHLGNLELENNPRHRNLSDCRYSDELWLGCLLNDIAGAIIYAAT